MNLMTFETNLDPFGGALETLSPLQARIYIQDRIQARVLKASAAGAIAAMLGLPASHTTAASVTTNSSK